MKKLLFCTLCVLLTALGLTSCASESSPSSASFQAMDTLMSLKVYGSADTCEQLQNKITELDSSLDATDEKSEIFRLNTEKSVVVSKDTAALLTESLSLCDQLDGCFDLTVYPAVQAWGFTTGDYRVPTDSELKTLSDKIDYTAVTLSDDSRVSLPENVMLDLGAVAKGYAADVSRTILADSKAQAAVLNLGGTICLYGKKPDGSRFTVGIADPENPAGYFGYLSCDDTTVATSGGYERYFEHGGKRYIHILDPATAAPVDNGILSVTIVSDSGAFADAASTALFVMGLDKATQYCRSHPGFDCIILTDDKSLYLTEGVYDDFILSDGYDFTLHKIS